MTRLVGVGLVMGIVSAMAGANTRADGQDVPYRNAALPVEARVADLMGRMTLDEKIGQMVQADSDALVIGDVSTYFLGSVLSGGNSEIPDVTPAGWSAYVERVQQQALTTRLAIPVLYGIDAVHGHNNVKGATIFPHNIGLGADAQRETRRGDRAHHGTRSRGHRDALGLRTVRRRSTG